MMPPNRPDLLRVLAELCAIHTQMRFGQLICNLTSFVELVPESSWTVADEPLLGAAEEHMESQLRRLDLASPPTLEDPARLELLQAVERYGARHPEWSLGRAVASLVAIRTRPASPVEWAGYVWDIEDEDLLSTAREQLFRPTPVPDIPILPTAGMIPHDHPTPTNA